MFRYFLLFAIFSVHYVYAKTCIVIGDSHSSGVRSGFGHVFTGELNAQSGYDVISYSFSGSRPKNWAKKWKGSRVCKRAFCNNFIVKKNGARQRQYSTQRLEKSFPQLRGKSFVEFIFTSLHKNELDCIIFEQGDNDQGNETRFLLKELSRVMTMSGRQVSCFWVTPTWGESKHRVTAYRKLVTDKNKKRVIAKISKSVRENSNCTLIDSSNLKKQTLIDSTKPKSFTTDGLHLRAKAAKLWGSFAARRIADKLKLRDYSVYMSAIDNPTTTLNFQQTCKL
ncbi:MAG: hypothetical protein ISR65_13240 [Bacteriovoracaceae bacterium]|nr:hypothetical protein [Bacteriovoracaceae bacterium]